MAQDLPVKFGNGEAKFSSEPFRHWVVDNYYDEIIADALAFDFPEPDENWYKYENHFETKRATDNLLIMPQMHVQTLLMGNTSLFLKPLEALTGIEGLIPDPAYRGGGLHQIMPGGKLDIHADFNFHKHLKLDRRLNVLLYLNKGYKPEYGGQLELWDKEMKECVVRIDPLFNRLVVFETTDYSYHGHPTSWAGNTPRRSLAWYFYTNGRPESEKSPPHSTKFQKRPEDISTPEIEVLRQKRNEGRL